MAIPLDFRIVRGIATPVCALARDDSSVCDGQTEISPTIVYRDFSSYKKPPIKKVLIPPWGTRTGNTKSCGTTLLAGKSGRLTPVPTHRLPITPAMRQKILGVAPFPPALSGPFAAPLFAPLSAPGTLCGCAMQLYFRFNGLWYDALRSLNYTFGPLSSTFFFPFQSMHRAGSVLSWEQNINEEATI